MKFILSVYLFVQMIAAGLAQTNGLLAYYPFNGNADDESGNGYNGTVMGATLVEDRFGNPNSAYLFDGVDDYIAYPTVYSASPNQLSVVTWFSTMDTESDLKIIYHGDNGEFQQFVSNDSVWGGIHLGQNVSDPWYYVRDAITQNEWNMIVSVWIQDGSLRLYLNGELVDSTGVEPGPLQDVGPGYQPSIGSYNRTIGAYFNGMIDDIRIYDRELTLSEIDSLYNEGTSSVEQISDAIPDKITLNQNYPNPFNPATTITFSVPQESYLRLEVYNSLGEKVAVLISDEISAGYYKYEWDAKNNPSGIYFYHLRTGSFVETKKMLLLK